MANAKSVEWMFGDASTGILGFHALADMNPLRWSGSLTFEKCVAQLEKVKTHGSRPVIVKVPAGISSREKKCSTVDEAIEYVKSKDPKLKSLKDQFEQACHECTEAEEVLKEKTDEKNAAQAALDERLAAEGSKPSVMTMWMYSDPESPLGGLGRFFAQFNPARWSDMQTAARTIKDLEGLQKHHEEHGEKPRGIRLVEEFPGEDKSGDQSNFKEFPDEEKTIAHLKSLIEVDDPEMHAMEDKLAQAKAHVKDAEKNLASAQAEKNEKEEACKKAGV